MKPLIVTMFLSLWLTLKLSGQSAKLIHDYSLKPKTDTAYVYIEKRVRSRDDKTQIEVWQMDLQTGERWYTVCPEKGYIPKKGEVIKMPRSKMQFIEPKK